MQGQEHVELAKEGAKAVNKLEEIILKVFGPHWTKKQADADAYADEKKLQTIRQNPDMEIIYANGEMHARLRSPEALLARAQQRKLLEEVRQEQNIEDVIQIASEEVEHGECNDNPVDEDWISRFFSIVRDVSTEDMKIIWGKILAGEIKKPGSYSLRTLETIRNMSQNEAKVFESIAPYIFVLYNGCFLPNNKEILRKYHIPYSNIMLLDECGLINSDGMLTFSPELSVKTTCSFHNGSDFLEIKGKSQERKATNINIYPLTKAGEELYNLLVVPNIPSDYMIDLAEWIYKGNPDITIKVYKIVGSEGEKFNCKKQPIETFGIESENN